MAPTSDERREVAGRLRSAAKTESGSPDYLWNRLEIAVNGWRFGDVIDESYVFYNSVLERLADLIESEEEDTCCDVSDDDDAFTCSRCGCAVRLSSAEADAFENVTYGPTLTMSNGRGEKLSFCPCCGARVTSGGER